MNYYCILISRFHARILVSTNRVGIEIRIHRNTINGSPTGLYNTKVRLGRINSQANFSGRGIDYTRDYLIEWNFFIPEGVTEREKTSSYHMFGLMEWWLTDDVFREFQERITINFEKGTARIFYLRPRSGAGSILFKNIGGGISYTWGEEEEMRNTSPSTLSSLYGEFVVDRICKWLEETSDP